MQGKVRRGLRVGLAAAIAMTVVLVSAVGGGARIADGTITSTVSIGNATGAVVEGQPASFPITIDQAATADYRVPWTTSEGNNGSFDVHTGDTTEPNISVPTNSNSTPEDDRSFTVTLQTPVDIPDDAGSDATTGGIGTATGSGTILDDDWQINSIATAPSNASAPASGGTIDFTVSLATGNAPATHAITVDYAVADGSAQNGRDYTVSNPAGVASGTLTFAPGTNSVDVQVKAKGDGLFGNNRSFTVTFSNPHGATFVNGANEQATGTITETDAPPLMGISQCTGSQVNAGDVASFPILLAGAHPATTLPASIDYTTVDDSTVPKDYEPTSGTAVIPVGQREFDVKVQTDVNPPVGDRSFHIQLSNPQNVRLSSSSASCTIHSTTGGGGGGQGSITITDPAPVTQPTSGSVPATVKLSLSLPNPLPANPQPVSVHWTTQDGSATAPTDYTAASGDITWPAGTNGANPTPVTLAINPDPATTAPITFKVAFTSTSATFVGGGTATITIVPAGSTVPFISIGDTSVPKHGGSVPVVVNMTPASGSPVTVDYATANGTDANAAKAGMNYTATNGTLTFAPGTTSRTINIPIISNEIVEPNRDFTVNLSNATGGAAIGVASGTVTILNDVATKTPPPVLTSKTTLPQPKPTPQPTSQPPNKGTHFVLVQMLTGTSHVDAKGRAPFKIACPSIVIRTCIGTAKFEIGVPTKVKKKTVIKTMRIASGAYSVHFGKTGTFTAKLTPTGLKLLKAVKRMKTKATLSSHDGAGAKGVTAWIVSLQTAAPAKKAPTVKKK